MELSVLIVDDEKVFRDYISEMKFWKAGRFHLSGEAKGTEEAMNFLRKCTVDVVVFDVSMPGKNGVVLSEQIAGKYPEISMIAVSSYDDYDYVRQILKNGAHDYILKSRLSEELLERTLEMLEARRRGISSWELKKELRYQAKEWILYGGINPFPADRANKIAALLQVPALEQYPETEQRAMQEGIGRIFESGAGEKEDILAIYAHSNQFIILYRFFEEVSESGIMERTRKKLAEGIASIRRVYGVFVNMQVFPPFFGDNALRSYVLHKLQDEEREEERTSSLAMTIGQQTRLLSAMERNDVETAEKLVLGIYEGIGAEEVSLLMVTKELLEILERIADENQLALDFLPKNMQLFTYTRGKSKETLVSGIVGLYHNVLREVAGRGTEHYSEIVSHAIDYMKEHCHEPVGLSMVATGIGANPSYLSRIFHEETGRTITEYLNGIRIERAQNLLQEDMALKGVAAQCGFKNYGYFLKIFKEYTQKTPKEYLLSVRKK